MSMQGNLTYVIIFAVLISVALWVFLRGERFDLPNGETVSLSQTDEVTKESNGFPKSDIGSLGEVSETQNENKEVSYGLSSSITRTSSREVFVTDGTKHSIPLAEIISGGPPKDGIPSIDNPKFVDVKKANQFLDNESVGLGLAFDGEFRFYPYQILVWHEIVNDTIQNNPILVSYCPLCATGIVFDRRVDGKQQEFGVSGLLWRSNLLMYNRTGDSETESLWSQVLGEAVLGPETGMKLTILRSDTVRYGEWKREHPKTKVLSRDTGASRTYGADPYGNYYTDSSVSFGATFSDSRLHPKTFIIGIEVDGLFKAYSKDALKVGITEDRFAGQDLTIKKSNVGEVEVFIKDSKQPIPTIGGFWFAWLAVHPKTELYK